MEDDKRKKRQWISAATAVGIHILAVGLLFVILMPPIKVPDLPAGILVSIGNMAEAEGTYDPHEIIPPEEVEPVEPTPTPPVSVTAGGGQLYRGLHKGASISRIETTISITGISRIYYR